MIQQKVKQGKIDGNRSLLLRKVLSASQKFMRNQKDECSFVSLRDVERTLKVLDWFQSQKDNVHDKLDLDCDPFCISLMLALGVAYYVRLDKRDDYANRIEHVSIGLLFESAFDVILILGFPSNGR